VTVSQTKSLEDPRALQLILGGMRDYALILDAKGLVTYINWLPKDGPLADVLGTPFAQGLDPAHQPMALAAFQACLETGRGVYAAPGLRRDGSPGWFEVHLELLSSASGAPSVVMHAFDRTEAKVARDFLEESETRFLAVAENAADGIMLLDASGGILLCNLAVAGCTGFSREMGIRVPSGGFGPPAPMVRSGWEPPLISWRPSLVNGPPGVCWNSKCWQIGPERRVPWSG